MLLDVVAKATRGKWDQPTADMLRQGEAALGKLPKSNLKIINRIPNSGVDSLGRGLKIGGITLLLADMGVAGYKIASAPPGKRGIITAKESARIAGSVTGGWAGAKGGAFVGGAIGTMLGGPGLGTAIGAGVGALIGGFGGAIAVGWSAETILGYLLGD